MKRVIRRRLAHKLLRLAGRLSEEAVAASQWFVAARPKHVRWSADPCANWAMMAGEGRSYCPECHQPAQQYNPLTDEMETTSPERCVHCGWVPKSLLELLAEQ